MNFYKDTWAVSPGIVAAIVLIVALFGATMFLPTSPDISNIDTNDTITPYDIGLPDEIPEQLNATGMDTCDNFITKINHPIAKTIGNMYCQTQYLAVKNIVDLGYDPVDIFFILMLAFGLGFLLMFMLQKQSSNWMSWVAIMVVIIAAIVVLLRLM